jgi:hypothetical protein
MGQSHYFAISYDGTSFAGLTDYVPSRIRIQPLIM